MNAKEQPAHVWDAGLYDGRHAFVWQSGSSLVELLAPKAGERILDLGCGTGHLTARIAEAGAAVVGLDQSVEMLQQARASYPHLEYMQGDARDFHLETFDAVFSNAALHWIRPPEQVAARVHGALKPGGRFVAEFGGRGNVELIIRAWRDAATHLSIALNEPDWYFPGVAEYATLLEAAGLEVTLAVLFDRPTPLESATGLRDWVKLFGRSIVEGVAEDRREEFLRAVEESARPGLFRQGGWFADYRRLRIVAHRPK